MAWHKYPEIVPPENTEVLVCFGENYYIVEYVDGDFETVNGEEVLEGSADIYWQHLPCVPFSERST